ncbi:diacylglycerol kinase [Candidatus Uhrbacteria bacterium]|nr:diacylglycerol kinase [Candidatus Uhrbacteria bacterium]
MIRLSFLGKSIFAAIRGAAHVWRSEQNFRIQIFAGLLAIVLAVMARLELWKLITIILLVAMVLILEVVNSVFERLLDLIKSRLHPSVRDMKDMLAAAVLLASLTALGIGVVFFLPWLRTVFLFTRGG